MLTLASVLGLRQLLSGARTAWGSSWRGQAGKSAWGSLWAGLATPSSPVALREVTERRPSETAGNRTKGVQALRWLGHSSPPGCVKDQQKLEVDCLLILREGSCHTAPSKLRDRRNRTVLSGLAPPILPPTLKNPSVLGPCGDQPLSQTPTQSTPPALSLHGGRRGGGLGPPGQGPSWPERPCRDHFTPVLKLPAGLRAP